MSTVARPVWPPERVDELRRLRSSGLTAAKCAPRFGVSRSAVLGALHRYPEPKPKPCFPRGRTVPMRDVVGLVASVYGVTVHDLKRTYGGRRVCEARHVAVYMSRRAGASCSQITCFFRLAAGSASCACRTVTGRREASLFDDAMIRLEAQIDRLSPETTTQERFQ